MRFQLVCGIAHDFEVEVMHARLVEDDVRKLRESVLDILYSRMANYFVWRIAVRLPERRFVDPARLLHHALAETERLEHLHGPAGNAVGLTQQQRTGLL